MWRSLLVCFTIVAPVSRALASFEVLHIHDALNGRVVRYDPVNQVSLGSYGAGHFSGAFSISAVNNRTMVWDSNQARIFVFNSGTGVLERQIPTSSGLGIMWETRTGGAFGNTVGGPVQLFRPDGTTLGTLAGFGTEYKPLVENDTHYFVFNVGANEMRRFRKSDFVQDLSWVNPNLSGGFLSWDATTAIFGGTLRMVLPERFGNRIRFLDVQTGGAQTFNINQFSTITGIASGHANILYIAGTLGNGNHRIIRYNPETQFSATVFEASNASISIESMSIVIAPEPGTMAALGVGLAAILRRRRR